MADAESQTAINTVKIEKTFRLPGVAFCLAGGDTSASLFFGCSDFHVYHIDPTAEKSEAAKVADGHHDSYVTGLVRHGNILVSGGYDGRLIWWDADAGSVLHRVDEAHQKWIRQLAISPDGATVASVADDMTTRLWNTETSEPIAVWEGYEAKTPHGYPSMLYAVTFSPDGQWLATGNKTGHVLIRNAASGEIAATLESPVMYTWDPKARRHSIGGIRSLAFSSDSKWLAVGGMGKVGNIDHLGGSSRIEIFDWQSGERKHEIEDEKHKGLVEVMSFGPGDEWLAAAGGDHSGFVSVYSLEDGKLLAQEKAPMHVHDFQLHADGRHLNAVGHQQGCLVSFA